jgi:transposase
VHRSSRSSPLSPPAWSAWRHAPRRTGPRNVGGLVAVLEGEADDRLPPLARDVLRLLAEQLASLGARIGAGETRMRVWFRSDATCRRLATIPGIGPIVATALVAAIGDPGVFKSGRNFAAWLGLTPRQNSTGGKARLGGITKRGDAYLRRLLLNGAQAVLRWSKGARSDPWLTALSGRKPPMVVAVALANKMARIVWAVWTRSTEFRRPALAA